MEEALFGRRQRALTVDGDRSALEHDRDRPHFLAGRLGVAPGDRCIGVVGRELAPPVERPVEREPPIAVRDEDRAGVTEPRVVDRELDDLDTAAARRGGPFALARGGDHRHRLEAGDRRGDEGVGVLGVGHQRAVQRLALRPAHHRPLVRRGLRRHAQHRHPVFG
jgi:hypothetical protein